MRRVVGVGVLLLLGTSIAANVYFLLTRSKAGDAHGASPPLAPEGPKQAVVQSRTSMLPVRVSPLYAQLDRAALELRLSETEAKLEKYLPLKDKYERAIRSPETEARARKLLDRVFSSLTTSNHAYEVECHGEYCLLTNIDRDIPVNDWMSAVQSDFSFRGWHFGPDGAYTTIPDPDEAARGHLMSMIAHELEPSEATILGCKKLATTPSTVTVTISADMTARKIRVATTPTNDVGQCLQKAFADALKDVVVPSDVTSMAPWELPFEVP